jgi:peptidoglycan hydrolase-like protein with peptidoglycan-binding domain
MATAFPAIAHASPAIPALAVGHTGGEVATWQATIDRHWRGSPDLNPAPVERFIRAHGYLAVDGVFGPLTDRATRLYQRQLHLRQPGTVTFASWKSVTEGTSRAAAPGS